MAYNSSIPQATNVPANSQSQLMANFTAIKTLVDVNHVTFDVANQGKHAKVDVPASLTHPLVAANELLFYNFANTMTAQNELYVKKAGILGVVGTPFTAAAKTTDGWTYLPSGLLLKWGQVVANGQTTITFPVAATIPVFTACLSVLLTVKDAAAGDQNLAIRLTGNTALNFGVYASHRTTVGAAPVFFYYLAIGY